MNHGLPPDEQVHIAYVMDERQKAAHERETARAAYLDHGKDLVHGFTQTRRVRAGAVFSSESEV